MFVIWSLEHQAWWRPDRRGYTCDLSEAGHYTREDAAAIVADANLVPGVFHECMIPVTCVTVPVTPF